MNHFYIIDIFGKVIVDNLKEHCKFCYEKCNSIGNLISVICPIYNTETRRQGKIENTKSKTFLCDTTKTTKLFRDKLEALSYAVPDLIISKKEIEEKTRTDEQKKVNRLVHNLTSINAHNIQSIYDIVPQEILSSNWRNQLDCIKKEIKNNPDKVAKTLLRLSNNNIHMKSEFSIYRKLDREEKAKLDFKGYPIRSVILNILHTFFVDFSNNGIYVNVYGFSDKVMIDYETIQVAIYHLIENATKYCKPNSELDITFRVENSNVRVDFKMISIYVVPTEREMIFNEGMCGSLAKIMGKNGDGIGMWRIKQMMYLNNGMFTAEFGEKEVYNGFDYAKNTFSLIFKKA